MRIAFLVEYFQPFIFGGSEVSSFHLAKGLNKKKLDVLIIAPNFGSKSNEKIEGVSIIRYPFPKKIKDNLPLTPFWHTSLVISIYRAIKIYQICKQKKISLIHVQEKYLLIAGLIAAKLSGIPIVVTLRDYQLLCNYGFCINERRHFLACNFIDYWREDFKHYLKFYLKKRDFLNISLNILFALRARIVKDIYRFSLRFVDSLICISQKQSQIYSLNGISENSVIYNSVEFKNYVAQRRRKQLLYAGKLSRGKGMELLFKSIKLLKDKGTRIPIVIAGLGEIDYYRKLAKTLRIEKQIDFVGQLNHSDLAKAYLSSLLTVVPSIWEEPFGRTALESLSFGTPVVATKKGGLPEIIKDGITGYLSESDPKSFAKAIEKGIRDNKSLSKNTRQQIRLNKVKFGSQVYLKHFKLYQKLIK